MVAQAPLPSEPAEVYQAKQIQAPFAEPALFKNDFETGNFSRWSFVAP